jgi:hypothetical protein
MDGMKRSIRQQITAITMDMLQSVFASLVHRVQLHAVEGGDHIQYVM